ncbi:MAG: hypothetical protein N3B12_02415, partial [Armatimonadetes bacterium]|nr:hypothetical protein [Armatimonadota bacterium]
MTVQTGVILFKIAFWAYALATIFYVIFVVNRTVTWGRTGRLLLCVGLALHTASLATRYIATCLLYTS